jgi:hypothetical protein
MLQKPNLNWGREFSKYIKQLQKTPKYKGFSYPCLATQKNILTDFKKKKERYLSEQKRREQVFRTKLQSYNYKKTRSHQGGRRHNSKTKKKRGGFTTSIQNYYNSVVGNPLVPSDIPYKGQLSSSY